MSEPLRDLLDRLAEEQPAVRVAPGLYRQGRRAHRRTTALRTVAATGLVAVTLVAAGPVLEGAQPPPAPADSRATPAMPSELYAVPERLVSYDEDGYTWHDDLLADGLAIGTTAAVFPVDGGAVMAVSAVDGEYRGLELPGFDERNYFAFEDTPVSLSPDGDRLAWSWNPDVVDGSGSTEVESGVRVADLSTGEVTDVAIPSRLGVSTHGLGWSPDGRYLAYGVRVVTASDEDTYATGRYRVERLDTVTWKRLRTPLRDTDTAPAVSRDGMVAVSGAGYNGTWTPGDRRVTRYQGPFDSVAWSDDGRTALASVRGHLAVGDGQGVSRESSVPSPGEGRFRALGWPDDAGFVLLDEVTATLDLVPADLEGRRTLVQVQRMPDLLQLSVATDLLAQPTRDTAEPRWPARWDLAELVTALGVVVVLAGVGLVLLLGRRT